MAKTIETLLYALKPGTGPEFDRIMREISVPLHRGAGLDVVAFGNSLHDADAYFLIRAFDSLGHLEASQDAFYRSEAWRSGPRQAIVDRIVTSLKVVAEFDDATVEALRRL